jgi:2,4-dienoyl-CoA reductase-like NADH-dependent reductase (Old Yellow Enzyme family)
MTPSISDSILLPASGRIAPNRFAKSATTECLASPVTHLPNNLHNELYRVWGESGCGILITGNVMIDGLYCESPRNMGLYRDEESSSGSGSDGLSSKRRKAFTNLAAAMHHGDKKTIALLQLSHPGRQCPVSCTTKPIGASSVPLNLPVLGKLSQLLIRPPRAMTNQEIKTTIQAFATSAKYAEECGFDGIQIHCAHGYLISQFLSPKTNTRKMFYGGSPSNRRRFLIEIID